MKQVLSASASLLVQIGSGSVANTGYIATGNFTNQANTTLGVSSTAGFPVYMAGTTYAFSGALVIIGFWKYIYSKSFWKKFNHRR